MQHPEPVQPSRVTILAGAVALALFVASLPFGPPSTIAQHSIVMSIVLVALWLILAPALMLMLGVGMLFGYSVHDLNATQYSLAAVLTSIVVFLMVRGRLLRRADANGRSLRRTASS